MESLSFGLPVTGSDIHFTWSNGVITLSDKFTGVVKQFDGNRLLFQDGVLCGTSVGISRAVDSDGNIRPEYLEKLAAAVKEGMEQQKYVRLPHPCVQNVVAGEDIAAGEFVQMKGEGSLRAAYRCFSIAEDMRKAIHDHFTTYTPENQSSCKCVSLLNGHEPGCPMEGK